MFCVCGGYMVVAYWSLACVRVCVCAYARACVRVLVRVCAGV